MTLNLLIAPDFAPERFAGWHMLNTLLQKRSGLQLHLLTPASAAEQAQLIAASRETGTLSAMKREAASAKIGHRCDRRDIDQHTVCRNQRPPAVPC